MKLNIATCQFPTSADIRRNFHYLVQQMREAKRRGADLAHFPEACLSGYAGQDFPSYRGFDWQTLEVLTPEVLDLARNLGLWVVFGSSHRLSGRNKPHNSVYVVNSRGKLLDRYDKRFCAGDRSCKTGDLAHYSPGDHFSVFHVSGVRCGVLICHEYRYPELHREYKSKGVQLIFHSFHAANIKSKQLKSMQKQVGREFHSLNRGSTLPEITMPASMQAASASSHLWISCSNSSARESCWPSFFVRSDGVIVGRLQRNRSGILLTEVDTKLQVYDSTLAWRGRALRGIFHSGSLVRDKRSLDRKCL